MFPSQAVQSSGLNVIDLARARAHTHTHTHLRTGVQPWTAVESGSDTPGEYFLLTMKTFSWRNSRDTRVDSGSKSRKIDPVNPIGGGVDSKRGCIPVQPRPGAARQVGRCGQAARHAGRRGQRTAVVRKLYSNVRGEDGIPVSDSASQILDTMIRNGEFEGLYTEATLPCSLQAFACAFASKRHVREFYRALVRVGLNKEDERGPIGGMSLAGMLNALADWERWAYKDAKERKYPVCGMDLHHLVCEGGTLLEHEVYPTKLKQGGVRQLILFIEDVNCKYAHFCAAGSYRPGAEALVHKWVRSRADYTAQVKSDTDAGPSAPKVPTLPKNQWEVLMKKPRVTSPKLPTKPVVGDTEAPTLALVPEAAEPGECDVKAAEDPTSGDEPPVGPGGDNVVVGPSSDGGPGGEPEPSGTPPGEEPPEDPGPSGGESPRDPVPLETLEQMYEQVEYIKTHNIAPVLDFDLSGIGTVRQEQVVGWDPLLTVFPMSIVTVRPRRTGTWPMRVRAYDCGGLVSEGSVAHADASYEGGVGLTELHPAVLERFNFTRNSYYYVTSGVEPNPRDGRYLTNGQYNPGWLATMQFGNMSYTLKHLGFNGTCEYYCLELAAHRIPKTGFFSCPDFILEAMDETSCWAADVGIVKQPQAIVRHATNMPGRELQPKVMKGVAGSSRARWAINAAYVEEDLRGPYHSLFVENADDPNTDATVARMALCSEKGQLEAQYGKRGYRTARLSGHKNCNSCGAIPPVKFKWKHRVCNECTEKLNKCGAVSTMGQQIQLNLTVAEGHPGRVHLESSTLPPKKSKWAKVDIPKGAITMSEAEVPWLKRNFPGHSGKKRKTFHSVVKEDLAKIDTSLERTKRECVLAGIGVSGCYPMVTRKGPYSRMQALIGRAFLKKPKSSPAAWKVMEKFKHLLLPKGALDGDKMTVEDWISSMPARRRRALERAYVEYINDGGLRDKDLSFSAFVKQELLASYEKFDWGDAKPLAESIARMIMAPKDKAHIVAGPIIKPKLERLKRHWSPENWLFYGATTPEKLQGWLDSSIAGCEDGDVFAFWCDYSMFDCTHSVESMRLVESFYSEMLTDPEFARLINAWRAPRGRMGEMKYAADVMLASGRDDTSLMNALLNGLVMGLCVAAAVAGVELEDLQPEHVLFAKAYIRISICGDDTLGFLPKHLWPDRARIMSAIERNISRFGLVTKLDCTCYLGSAVYLGMRPYNVPTPTGRRWLWGRTVGRAAFKFGWMLDLSKGDAAAWATGVADSVVRTQPYVPILSDLARQTLKLREGARRTPVVADENKPWTNWTVQVETQNLTYDRQTLLCLEKSYATPTLYGGEGPVRAPSVEDFLRTIRTIEAVPCLPYVIDDMALRFMCVTDDC